MLNTVTWYCKHKICWQNQKTGQTLNSQTTLNGLALQDIGCLHYHIGRKLIALNNRTLFSFLHTRLRSQSAMQGLTHWGRVTHICVSNITIIGSDNGLSPGWRQAIIWTNADILLIGHIGTNFNEILIEIHTFSFKKIHFKMSSGKRRPFCLGFNVLTHWHLDKMADIFKSISLTENFRILIQISLKFVP